MDWYYVVDGKWNGPHSQDKITTLLRAGKISSNTLVWREGMDDWTPIGSVEGFDAPPDEASRPTLDTDTESEDTDTDSEPEQEEAEADSVPDPVNKAALVREDTTGLAFLNRFAESFAAGIDHSGHKAGAVHQPVTEIIQFVVAERRAFLTIAAVVVGIAGSAFFTWHLLQTGKDRRESVQSHKRNTVEPLVVKSRLVWRNPITGLSAVLPRGWKYESLHKKGGLEVHSFASPNALRTVHVAAIRNLSSGISLRQFGENFIPDISPIVTFTDDWRRVKIDKKLLLRREAKAIKSEGYLTYLIYKNEENFWRIIAVNTASYSKGDPLKWPIFKLIVGTFS